MYRILNKTGTIALFILSLLFLVMTIISGLKTDPPASVCTTGFRMPYQYLITVLTPVIGAGLVLKGIHSFRNHGFGGLLPGITFFFFLLIFIGGILFQVRILTATAVMTGMSQMSEASVSQRESSTQGEKENQYGRSASQPDCWIDEDKSAEAGMQQLIVTTPEDGTGTDCCVIHLNYGGWQAQDVSMESWMKKLCISERCSYVQLAGKGLESGNIIDIVNDAKKGIAWVLENYQFENIYLSGESAGGTIALLAAFSEKDNAFEHAGIKVDGVMALYPITDPEGAYRYFVSENTSDSLADKMGDELYSSLYNGDTGSLSGETEKLMTKVFGIYGTEGSYYGETGLKKMISESEDIPVLMIQGSLDSMVSVEDNREFAAFMEENEKPFVYLELPGLDHAFDLMPVTVQNYRIKKEVKSWMSLVNK